MTHKQDSNSIQSQLGRGLILLVFVTTQTLGVAQAQTTADPRTSNVGGSGGVLGAIGGVAANFSSALPALYQQNPQQLMLAQQQAQLQSALAACQAKADPDGLSGVNSTAANVAGTTSALTKLYAEMQAKAKERAANKSGKTAAASTDPIGCDLKMSPKDPRFCDMKCPDPVESKTIACGKFYKKESGETDAGKVATWSEMLDPNPTGNKFEDYASYYRTRIDACGPGGTAPFKKSAEALTCMMTAMRNATAAAAQAVQATLAANQAQYAKMNQYQGEVQSQINQVEKLLGPDPKFGEAGGEFKGLLGLQNELQTELLKSKEAQGKFEGDVAQVEKDELANNQTLETERIQVVASCIQADTTVASGGHVYMCPTAEKRKTADGKEEIVPGPNAGPKMTMAPCGTVDYLKAKIGQQAMLDNGHYQSKDNVARQDAQFKVAAFDRAIDALMREMGSYDQSTPEGRMQTNIHSWADIEKNPSIMGKLVALDADPKLRGVNIVGTLRNATQKCMNDSNTWRTRQMSSGASRYAKEKLRVDTNRGNLNRQLEKSLSEFSKQYKNVISLLGDMPTAPKRDSCKSGSVKLLECYRDVQQNLEDLLDGNDRVATTPKVIKGGTMLPPITVACRGINGCVTQLKVTRDRQQNHLEAAQQEKTKFVNQGNQQVQQQLQAFAGVLTVGNSAIAEQFNKFKASMIAMGVTDIPDSLAMLEPENLEPAMSGNGEQKEAGPFQNPKNMAAVLSGLSGGIIDPKDSGLGKAIASGMTAIKEKKDAWSKKADEFAAAAQSYHEGSSSCTEGGKLLGKGGPSGVNNAADDCNNSTAKANSEQAQSVSFKDLAKLYGEMDQIFQKRGKGQSVFADATFGDKLEQFNEAKVRWGCSAQGKRMGSSALQGMDPTTFIGK